MMGLASEGELHRPKGGPFGGLSACAEGEVLAQEEGCDCAEGFFKVANAATMSASIDGRERSVEILYASWSCAT
jgi:hypothetical protein